MDTAKIKGIIFDYGGTLDTNGLHWAEVLWQEYVKTGVPVTKEQFREAYVYGERTLALNPIITPTDNFRDVLLKKCRLQTDYLREKSILPDTAETKKYAEEIAENSYLFAKACTQNAHFLLQKLHDKYSLTLVSNFYGNIQTVLDNFALLCYFEHIVESAVVGVRKPDPEIFRLGVEAMKLSPDEVVVVGDSFDKDIIPAQKAGCHTIWLKGKGWEEKEYAEKADCTIGSILELEKIFNINKDEK